MKKNKYKLLIKSLVITSFLVTTSSVIVACTNKEKEQHLTELKNLSQHAKQIYNEIKTNELFKKEASVLNDQINKVLKINEQNNLDVITKNYNDLKKLLDEIQEKISKEKEKEKQQNAYLNKEINIKLENLNQIVNHNLLKENKESFFNQIINFTPITTEIQTIINQNQNLLDFKNEELELKLKNLDLFIKELDHKFKNIIDQLFNIEDSYINKFLKFINNQDFIKDQKYKEREKFNPQEYLELTKSIESSFNKLKNVTINSNLDQYLNSLNLVLLSLTNETKAFFTKFEDQIKKYFKWIVYGRDDTLTKAFNRIIEEQKRNEFKEQTEKALLTFPMEINQKFKMFVVFFTLKNDKDETEYQKIWKSKHNEVNKVWFGIAECFATGKCTDKNKPS